MDLLLFVLERVIMTGSKHQTSRIVLAKRTLTITRLRLDNEISLHHQVLRFMPNWPFFFASCALIVSILALVIAAALDPAAQNRQPLSVDAFKLTVKLTSAASEEKP